MKGESEKLETKTLPVKKIYFPNFANIFAKLETPPAWTLLAIFAIASNMNLT